MAAMAANFFRKPLVRSALTSCVVMSCGDAVCQGIQKYKPPQPLQIDWERTSRFGLVGLTLHGPFFYTGFKALDTHLGSASTLRLAVLKTAVGQVTLFPLYLVAFYSYIGALEGLDAQSCLDKVKACFPATYAMGSLFWPAANVLNFRFVPVSQRVLYINCCGLLWNSYLSWANSDIGAVAGRSQAAAPEVLPLPAKQQA